MALLATGGNSVGMFAPATKLFFAVSALAALAVGCSKSGGPKDEPMPAIPAAPAGVQQTSVQVGKKGFSPSEVKLEKGKPAQLVFVRTTDETCAKEVVFPELKIEKDLPLNTPVKVDIPTTEARTLTFQCGMAMYKSAVLIQ
jgi:plastocyanin domain-containing protein